MPCGYECRICPMEDLIAALPDAVTEDNAEDVRWKLNEILALYTELTWEEQEKLDLTRCYVYTGADKDNYKNVTVTVKIVRAGSTEKPVSLTEVKIKGMVSETKKQLTVSWDKVEGADGYEVIYASNKSFTKNKVTKKTTKTSLTLKKLNEKKTWYVKVRAYAKKGTKTYTGKYSAARYIKLSQRPANVKKVTVKPGTKKLSVTAGSVKGATGYEIVVSTDKAGKKTVTRKKRQKARLPLQSLGKGRHIMSRSGHIRRRKAAVIFTVRKRLQK